MQVVIKGQTPSIVQGEAFDTRIATLLGLDPLHLTQKDKERLAFLSQYLKSQSDDEIQQLNIIRDLKFRLGTPQIGQDWLDHVYRYVKLKEAAKINEIQAKEMESGAGDPIQ